MAEPIRLLCPQCRAAYRLKIAVRPGATVTCSKCGAEMVVPEPPSAPPIAAASDFAGSSDDRQVTLAPRRDSPTLSLEAAAADESHPSHVSHSSHPSPALAEEGLETVLMEAPPQETGRYIEQGLIGRGGMGEVMLCIDRNTRRQIALKRILPQAASDPARRARFVEEAQVTAQLEHPNIVPVHELDRTPDGSIYFTMKLVKGRSLADLLKAIKAAGDRVAQPPSAVSSRPYALRGDESPDAPRPPLSSLSDLLQVFLKVCDGVAFAHSRGVIHRDLKPANIMVGEYGEVLVMDWGLAKLLGSSSPARPYAPRGDASSDAPRPPASPLPPGEVARRAGEGRPSDGQAPSRGSRPAVPHPSPLPEGEGKERRAPVLTDRHDDGLSPTLDGSAVGTPAYMSPEQANGELDRIDQRSDIYSLGAILYEILTLERAIEGETPMMILANAARNRIVPIEKRAAGRHVSRELAAIAMKCLAKTRAARYRTVLDLRRDVSLFLEGRSVSAKPDSFGQSLVKLVKRNKGISASIAAAAVILIALTAAFIIRLAGETRRALTGERRATLNEQAAVAAQQQQRATALKALEGLAQAAIRAADEGRFADADFRANAALQVMPDGPWGHYALGAVASEKKDFAAAREHLDEALQRDPSHQPSKAFLGKVIVAAGKLGEAEKLAAATEHSTDWRSLVAAGDALFAAQRNRQASKAYARSLALLEKEAGIPEPHRAEIREKRERAEACLKMDGFPESIRNLRPEEQARRLQAKLQDVYGSGAPVSCSVEKGSEMGVTIGGGSLVRWLDPFKGLPLRRLNITATNVTDLMPLKGMPLTEFQCRQCPKLTSLAPLRGTPLKSLNLCYTELSDLTPLEGMPLESVSCFSTRIHDLEPLRGSPLSELDVCISEVFDLSPLKGMRLRSLAFSRTRVADLSPLKGMPLKYLACCGTRVTDLSPLDGMQLESLAFTPKSIAQGMDVLRAMKTLRSIGVGGGAEDVKPMAPEEFWRRYDAGEFK